MTVRTAVAAVTGLVMAIGLSACGGKTLETKTLNFNEKDTNNFGFADNPPKATIGQQGPDRMTPGDTLAFSSDLTDTSGKTVGALDATCVDTRPGRFDQANVTCHGTATLPKGQLFLSVGGKGAIGNNTTGAVTGGTGDYAGATGSFTSKNGKITKDTFKLFIPKK
ncbi:MAG: hypothetical protein QOE65_767 [Solirubrobacteraceae bacterium]|jgi:hypothetical protein|nr:hypothetical protein [Solirubrobacteraceae bacterium]